MQDLTKIEVKVSFRDLVYEESMDVTVLGFDKFFQKAYAKFTDNKRLCPGRVVQHSRKFYTVLTADSSVKAKLSGKFIYENPDRSTWPAVGDWIVLEAKKDKAIIVSVLPRKSCFSRRRSGNVVEKQVISANIDVVFIVMSLDQNYNINRLQRYISSAASSGASPVILLNKSDLCETSEELKTEVKEISRGAPVHTLSSFVPEKTSQIISTYLKKGVTGVFTGSSGVGKSTIINILVGEELLRTGAVSSAVNKGRHTTSSRELIVLESGGMVIDTPGMRELQLWELEASAGFDKIIDLSQSCRFSNCSHSREPDCAVLEAVKKGDLSEAVLESWRSHVDEVRELEKQKERTKKIFDSKRRKSK